MIQSVVIDDPKCSLLIQSIDIDDPGCHYELIILCETIIDPNLMLCIFGLVLIGVFCVLL